MLVQDYLEYWARRAPERVCVADDRDEWSYCTVDRRANQFAHSLARLGVHDDHRFAVLAKNCAQWAVVYAGAFKAGAIPVPLNYRHHPREWLHPMHDSGSTVILTEPSYAEAFDQLRGELPEVEHYVLTEGAREGWRSLGDLTLEEPEDHPGILIEPDHTLYQMYTSGTTGKPKGAVLTHRAVHANTTQIRTALALRPDERNMLVMPLFHTGSAVNLFTGWAAGLSAYIVKDFDPEQCARYIDENRITLASLAPAMIQAMLVHAISLRERPYTSLEKVLYGASPINEETLRQILAVWDCDFFQAYGQTEATACLTMLGPEDHRRALAEQPSLLQSAGRALPGVQIEVVGEDGSELATGQIGEIRAKGPQLMSGYWNLPAETGVALQDGWLYTGDAGYLDEEGYLYVSDRVKDMIVSGAENIFPKEIEDVLYELDGVAEAVVIGVPSQQWGEAVKAVVVTRPGAALSEELVIDHCRGHLAGYKCPKSVDFVDELPRNASGKVLKRVLREPYWAGQRRHVG